MSYRKRKGTNKKRSISRDSRGSNLRKKRSSLLSIAKSFISRKTKNSRSPRNDGSCYSGKSVRCVKPPERTILKLNEVFKDNKPNVELIKQHFCNEGRLEEEAAIKIIQMATDLFNKERNVIYLTDPLTIVGDIHGQYYDLLKILELGGDPSNNKYLFLGDYVDRGYFSIEVLLLLYAFKIKHPNTFVLLRGNHECTHLTEHFTFKRECIVKYTENVYKYCTESFNALPLAAIVNKLFFCVHGGIPNPNRYEKNAGVCKSTSRTSRISNRTRASVTIEDILRINRFQEPESSGDMCDLLWSDPLPDFDKNINVPDFTENATRGCSYYYSYNAVVRFLEANSLTGVIRAHEAQDVGFRMYKRNTCNGFPVLITIFSAPNYLDVYNNKGAILKYDKDLLNAKQFNFTEHPYWLPNFMDVFTWSLPFIYEKVSELLAGLLNTYNDDDSIEYDEVDETAHNKEKVKNMLVKVNKLCMLYSKIRNRTEMSATKLKSLTPSKIPDLNNMMDPTISDDDSLLKEDSKIFNKRLLKKKLSFDDIKKLDRVNERVPKDNNKLPKLSNDSAITSSTYRPRSKSS